MGPLLVVINACLLHEQDELPQDCTRLRYTHCPDAAVQSGQGNASGDTSACIPVTALAGCKAKLACARLATRAVLSSLSCLFFILAGAVSMGFPQRTKDGVLAGCAQRYASDDSDLHWYCCVVSAAAG